MSKEYPTDAALGRLHKDKVVSVVHQRSEEAASVAAQALAQRLGETVWHTIGIANKDPKMQHGEEEPRFETVASWSEFRIGLYTSAWLYVAVDEKFDRLQGAENWLPNFKRMELWFNRHKTELPEDAGSIPDAISTVVVHIRPAGESDFRARSGYTDPHQPLYVAHYEHGLRLDGHDTKTVIGTLALMADKAAELSL